MYPPEKTLRERVIGAGGALAVHLSMLLMMTTSFSFEFPPRKEPREALKVFDVPGPESDEPIFFNLPAVAPPKSEPKQVEESEEPEEPVEPQEQVQSEAESESVETTPAGGGTNGDIWTPPPPRAEQVIYAEAERGEALPTVTLPEIELPEGSKAPVLVYFDEGIVSDPQALAAMADLPSGGSVSMTVTVSEAGLVTDCVVTISSRSSLLDQRACALVGAYRYLPGAGPDGAPRETRVEERLEWTRRGAERVLEQPPENPAAALLGETTTSATPLSQMPGSAQEAAQARARAEAEDLERRRRGLPPRRGMQQRPSTR